MAKIIFEGWEIGMGKISFTKLLHEKAGISLSDAKNITDRLLDNVEVVEIIIDDKNLAEEILEEALKLKVKGRLEN